jgi:hypothetical protein
MQLQVHDLLLTSLRKNLSEKLSIKDIFDYTDPFLQAAEVEPFINVIVSQIIFPV